LLSGFPDEISSKRVRVVVVACSTSAQRGLNALVEADPFFEVVEMTTWESSVSHAFDLLLGEVERGEVPDDIPEPYLLLCQESVMAPGAGRGFLSREADDITILTALHAVWRGLSVRDAGHLQSNGVEEGEQYGLTPRELELLALLGEGYSNREIAEAVHISPNTVKFHLSSIFSKLQVTGRAEAVSVGMRSGLLMV